MTALTVTPDALVFPDGVTHMRSGQVAKILNVGPRAVAHWERTGLLTASRRTTCGHRRFTAADVQAFLREVRTAIHLTPGDVVACSSWNDGRPVRLLHVTPGDRYGVLIRWQDIAAHAHAMDVLVGRNKLVRCLSHREAA